MKTIVPIFRTDDEAENFVDTADLSDFDLSRGIPTAEWMPR